MSRRVGKKGERLSRQKKTEGETNTGKGKMDGYKDGMKKNTKLKNNKRLSK